MFSGLVAERGRLIGAPQPSREGGVRLVIGHSPAIASRLGLGASLAVAGVCLTVTVEGDGWSAVELSPETLSRTRLGGLPDGAEVNLEPALRMGDALGGHWVQGHVDGTVRVVSRRDLASHRELGFELPREHAAAVVDKGSVCLDGVSLTVASVGERTFSVALIPHTLAVTTLSSLVAGDRVHLEVDVLAKYVARALACRGFGEVVRPGGEPA